MSPGYIGFMLIDFVRLEIQFRATSVSFASGKARKGQSGTDHPFNSPQFSGHYPPHKYAVGLRYLFPPQKGDTHLFRRCPSSRIFQTTGRGHGSTANVQEDTDIPIGPALPPILPQLSKAPTPTNLPDSPFEFETDPTALKVSKLEKLFKKSQGAHSIPDIEDGYIDSVVTLLDRFKMPHMDRFDKSGDPMVHLRLFSDILRPMGLSKL
ncbi:hypothetical protein ACSBR2_024248 [Camellia fascicularis]